MKINKLYRDFGPDDLIVKEPKSSLDSTIETLLQQPEYQGKTKDYFLNALDKIAFVESKNQNIKQVGGGPGRGYFQIEKPTLDVGYNRLANFNKKYGTNIGVKKAEEALELPYEDQAAITLINLTRGGASLPDFDNTEDVWLKRHWAGPEEQLPIRKEHFESAMRAYKMRQNKPKPASQNIPMNNDAKPYNNSFNSKFKKLG